MTPKDAYLIVLEEFEILLKDFKKETTTGYPYCKTINIVFTAEMDIYKTHFDAAVSFLKEMKTFDIKEEPCQTEFNFEIPEERLTINTTQVGSSSFVVDIAYEGDL